MQNNLFSTLGGLLFEISRRCFGLQDKGISPAGAQDQISFKSAYNIFEKPNIFQAIEMIYPAQIKANTDMLFIICGANYEKIIIDDNTIISKDRIYKLNKGQILKFEGRKSGFRTLIFAIEYKIQNNYLIGKIRSNKISGFINHLYLNKHIRVLKGPEYNILNTDDFFHQDWKISQNSSQMGLVLEGERLSTTKLEMISQPVTDGTVQLSPKGPIALMRHRQTVGGYPRIVNVIESDISKLAQFSPGEKFKFKLISFEEALKIKQELESLFID